MAYAFSGFATAAGSAGETKDPRKTIYRSVIAGLVAVAVFYAFVQWAYIAIGPEAAETDAPLAAAAQKNVRRLGRCDDQCRSYLFGRSEPANRIYHLSAGSLRDG